MLINSVTEIYFSPTNTTKKVINGISNGMGLNTKEAIDITKPESRNSTIPVINGDIVIIGVPVYGTRVPNIASEFLRKLKGENKPIVIVGVYGNISAGIVLNHLNAIVTDCGFKVVAAATFIGEHSFSSDRANLAKNRPNNDDLNKAERFGQDIMVKMQNINNLNDVKLTSINLSIPREILLIGEAIPNHGVRIVSKKPKVDKTLCIHCNICAEWCPTGAIDNDTLEINEDKCLRCFSCVKRCSKRARKIIYRPKFIVSKVFKMKNKVVKEPQIYL